MTKKRMKKLLSLFLVPMMVVAVVPMSDAGITAQAVKYTEGYLTYKISNGEAKITGSSDLISGDFVIPDTLGGYPVTMIDEYAFICLENLTGIVIPNSVTSIGACAFEWCIGLTDITIPDSVTSIGEYAFGYKYDDIGVYYKISDFTIYGYKNSAAETYAKDNGFKFIDLDAEQHTHTYTSKIIKAATCTAESVKTYTYSCGDSYTEKIAKTAHKSVAIKATPATCTTAGKTAGQSVLSAEKS